MKKPTFTNNSDIRLGFEIESVIKGGYGTNTFGGLSGSKKWKQFCKKLYSIKKKSISIGYDGSIQVDSQCDKPCEIRTIPLPPKDAMEVLKSIFDVVNEFGYTNRSCGLHVNISSIKKSKMMNFNPLPFISSKLWNEILKDFNRESNNYCRPIHKLKSDKKISMVQRFTQLTNPLDGKYYCVTLHKFGNGKSPTSRAEIRGMGNKDYTTKFDKVAHYVGRIERLFKYSCGAKLEIKVPKF
jgi:hypothetical protein